MNTQKGGWAQGVAFLRERLLGFTPAHLLILGSGLGYLADELEDCVSLPYEQIPGFLPVSAPGHAGKLLCGTLCGAPVAILQGRWHAYEGYTWHQVAVPVRILARLGVKSLLVTNAAGAVNPSFAPGDIMLITDHIKLFGTSPLTGPNDASFGPRFPDMSFTYTPRLQALARQAAQTLSLPLREGVYMYFPGPQYETPAEIRAARILGADAVGMSTVPEVIAARHAGLDILGFSLLSNLAAGVGTQPLTEEEVLREAKAAAPRFAALIRACLRHMDDYE